MIYELTPQYDARKSFYSKAFVHILPSGALELYSYGTHVATLDPDNTPHLHGLYSTTTGRHVREFFRQNNVPNADLTYSKLFSLYGNTQ
jgi:hypothetical protein